VLATINQQLIHKSPLNVVD